LVRWGRAPQDIPEIREGRPIKAKVRNLAKEVVVRVVDLIIGHCLGSNMIKGSFWTRPELKGKPLTEEIKKCFQYDFNQSKCLGELFCESIKSNLLEDFLFRIYFIHDR